MKIMNLGKLSNDFCIICGKATKVYGVYLFHVIPDNSHQPKIRYCQIYQELQTGKKIGKFE